MNAYQLTRLLITGSRKMDQIKSDICAAMALIAHAVRKAGNNMEPGNILEFEFENAGLNWHFFACLGPSPESEIIRIGCRNVEKRTQALDITPGGRCDINTTFACDVYEGLPSFIGRLLSKLPGLENEFAPFLRAAQIDLRR